MRQIYGKCRKVAIGVPNLCFFVRFGTPIATFLPINESAKTTAASSSSKSPQLWGNPKRRLSPSRYSNKGIRP